MFNVFWPSTSHHGVNFFGVFNLHHPCEMFSCYSSSWHHRELGVVRVLCWNLCCSCLLLKSIVVCVCHWSGVLHVVLISNPLQIIFQCYYLCSSLELSIVHIYH